MAAQEYNVYILQELWVWAEGTQLNSFELRNKLFLVPHQYRITEWHRAERFSKFEALETLCSWAKEAELNTDELLLAKNKQGYIARQLATQRRYIDVSEKQEIWAIEAQLNPQFS